MVIENALLKRVKAEPSGRRNLGDRWELCGELLSRVLRVAILTGNLSNVSTTTKRGRHIR